MPKPPSFVALPPRPMMISRGAVLRRVPQHFAHSKSGGTHRISFVRRELRQAGRGTHFHDGETWRGQPGVAALARRDRARHAPRQSIQSPSRARRMASAVPSPPSARATMSNSRRRQGRCNPTRDRFAHVLRA